MDLEKIKELDDVETPFLIINKTKLLENFEEIRKGLTGYKTKICFSIKANNDERVIKSLADNGSWFDVASWGEIETLIKLKVPPTKITFSAPTKIPSDIQKAYNLGVRLFAFDSEMELEKLSKLAPRSKVFLRLAVPNTGSDWPLERKFGAPANKAVDLLEYAKFLSLVPFGIAFHVGSQCHNKNTWTVAMKKSSLVWKKAASKGIKLQLLNIGGGFPVKYTKEVPSVEDISSVIKKSLHKYFDRDTLLFVEPGRYIVGDAGILVSSVINKVKRGRENWLYLDTGVYNGLQEILEGWKYEIITKNGRKKIKKFTIAGPTCDSTDIIGRHVELADLQLGERVYFKSAGAYTTSYQEYNGIPYPKLLLLDKG